MKKKLWFTLIEMLIAITVFAIGVLAVLRVITWNLSIMDHTDMKLQSTVLAKEWLELLYNLRDSNLEKGLPWNCVLDNGVYLLYPEQIEENWICAGYFGSGDFTEVLQLSFDSKNYYYQKLTGYSASFDDLFENNKLCTWANTDETMVWYAYCSWQTDGTEMTPTFFARYLSFTGVSVSDDESSDVLPVDKIIKVESHVLYKKWHKTGDIVFESFIWNY